MKSVAQTPSAWQAPCITASIAIIAASIYATLSMLTLIAFGLDKRAAIKNARRTPERTLHQMSWLGGWPGAFVAMELFRHKRRKPAFVRRVYLIAGVHVLAWLGVVAYLIYG